MSTRRRFPVIKDFFKCHRVPKLCFFETSCVRLSISMCINSVRAVLKTIHSIKFFVVEARRNSDGDLESTLTLQFSMIWEGYETKVVFNCAHESFVQNLSKFLFQQRYTNILQAFLSSVVMIEYFVVKPHDFGKISLKNRSYLYCVETSYFIFHLLG